MTGNAVPNTYLDIHVLQSLPPSNINRDDAGSPKQATYGGVSRARVSSQAWKRAARVRMDGRISDSERGIRSARLAGVLAERLAARSGLELDAALRITTDLIPEKISRDNKRKTDTSYLLFVGDSQLDVLLDLVADRAQELAALADEPLQKELRALPTAEVLAHGHPLDVALFGRMVADLPMLNVDAATQVAHAISTHPVNIEFDYFTAVDDAKDRAESVGAAMIGTVEFNSATLYRFSTVAVHQLYRNLAADTGSTVKAVELFLDAFIRSIPSGHQNTFASRGVPYLVSVVAREDQPVNLATAFEKPIRSSNGHAVQSAQRLGREKVQVEDLWGVSSLGTFSTYAIAEDDVRKEVAAALGTPMPLDDVISQASNLVRERLEGAAS
jgi:CRISPR system Cascade subunit CasC